MVGWGTTTAPGGPTRFVALAPDGRGCCFMAMSTPYGGRTRNGWFWEQYFSWNPQLAPRNEGLSRTIGFEFWLDRGTFGSLFVAVLPSWFLVFLSGALPGWYAATEPARRRARSRAGPCARCGYDLRSATDAGRCPKCGTPPPSGGFEIRVVTDPGGKNPDA
jgi:hypothetical protein